MCPRIECCFRILQTNLHACRGTVVSATILRYNYPLVSYCGVGGYYCTNRRPQLYWWCIHACSSMIPILRSMRWRAKKSNGVADGFRWRHLGHTSQVFRNYNSCPQFWLTCYQQRGEKKRKLIFCLHQDMFYQVGKKIHGITMAFKLRSEIDIETFLEYFIEVYGSHMHRYTKYTLNTTTRHMQ